jgi:NAD(P)H-dependent flavin oxidoreductase YrpB (nitropropane dioxygenase family)
LKVLIQVGSVEEAESAAAAGVDAVIAQGVEAGGHVRGTTSIWELLPATVDAVKPTPVLAHRALRDRLYDEWVAAGRPTPGKRPGEGTSIGRRRRFGEVVDWQRYAVGMATPDFDGDVELTPMWAGESCAVVNDIKPAAQIVEDLVRDAEAVLAGLVSSAEAPRPSDA